MGFVMLILVANSCFVLLGGVTEKQTTVDQC